MARALQTPPFLQTMDFYVKRPNAAARSLELDQCAMVLLNLNNKAYSTLQLNSASKMRDSRVRRKMETNRKHIVI